jgi:hypothetical protein
VRAFLMEKNDVLLYIICMLELSRFLGITIAMYFKDHNPPHFHVLYNWFKEKEMEERNNGKYI